MRRKEKGEAKKRVHKRVVTIHTKRENAKRGGKEEKKYFPPHASRVKIQKELERESRGMP